MKLPSSEQVLGRAIPVLGMMLGVKIVWVGVTFALFDSSGVEYNKISRAQALPITSGFSVIKEDKQAPVVTQVPATDINALKLLAVYRSRDIVVVTILQGSLTKVLSKGDTFEGYRLEDATAREAIFTKDGKNYRIELVKAQTNGTSSVNYPKSSQAKPVPVAVPNKGATNIRTEDDITTVDRNLFTHYRKNMDEIWKNIGIGEAKENGQTVGFRVNFIKRDSDFAKLGLRRGDIIQSVNGIKVDGLDKAMAVYKEMENMEDIAITIKRGDETMELDYAVN